MDGVAEKVGVWSSHVTDSIPAPAHAQSGRADRSPVSTVLIGLTDPRPSHPVSEKSCRTVPCSQHVHGCSHRA